MDNLGKFRKEVLEKIPSEIAEKFLQLFDSYCFSLIESGFDAELICLPLFQILLRLIEKNQAHPFFFEPFHKKITQPFNYYQFGIDFVRPLVDEPHSKIVNLDVVDKMDLAIKNGENVILLANHQTEVDPQLLSIALEKTHPNLAQEVIFVAGDRVLTDPMAVPFSMGRNLLCIFSKRHIENPPEKKAEKLQHNQRTMKTMRDLLAQGGYFIYVAPSGGRDRMDEKGKIQVAPFDPQSVEMFRLMAVQAKTPTHFYPLTLATYDILPPPLQIERSIGERRKAKRDAFYFSFGDELHFNAFPANEIADRHERRQAQANYIWMLIKKDFEQRADK